ncbi:MAG: hypothetical protein RQ761_12530, partial [Bacteroidales bacterium]|nr:hypothetical protein [Bacteroidales bacterium]
KNQFMQTAGTVTLLPRLGEAGRGLRWHVSYNPMHGGSGGNGSIANLSNGQSSTSGSNWGYGFGIKNKKAYLFTYTAEPSKFNDDEAVASDIIESFKFL